MRKILDSGYVIALTNGTIGLEISDEEYGEILGRIQNAPVAPPGQRYMLRADNLEWELVELPPEPEPDVDPAEAMEILFGGDGE